MGVIRIDIAGVDVGARVSEASIEFAGNERAMASLVAEGILPAVDSESVWFAKDGTTPIFGGLVRDRRVSGVSPNSLNDLVEIQFVDWEIFTDWCSVSLSFDEPVALETVIADLVNPGPLQDYGVTYTPVATGVLLAPFSVEDAPVSDVVRQLRERSGRLIRFMPDKSIEVQVPGGSAPFAITDAALPRLSEFGWADKPRAKANRVVLTCGPSSGAFLYTGQRTSDGVATSWTFDIRGSTSPWTIKVGAAFVDITPVGGGGRFEWDEGTFTLHKGTDPVPTNGTVIEVGYWVDYPFKVARSTGATPPRTHRESRPNVLEVLPAFEVADQLLARLDRPDARELTIATDEDGFDIGQALTVNTTARGGVVNTFLIGALSVELVNAEHWLYTFHPTEAEEPQATYQDEWRQIVGGGGGGASIIGGGGGAVVTVLSSPVYLGGDDARALAAADWARVIGAVPFVAQASFAGRVRCELWARDAGVGVTARLRNVTDGTAEASSEFTTQTRHTPATFVVSIVAGKTYRLEVKATTGIGDVYCSAGQLEAA
jgi:hypothetical protein